MSTPELQRVYCFSDCFGGSSANPMNNPDADALISTDIRSFPGQPRSREFDTFHAPEITDHILRAVIRLHEEIGEVAGRTGILINSAPRTKKGENGHPFFLARILGDRIRVVAPLHALSAVKSRVDDLKGLPNRENGLHGDREQFRSSFVGRLLSDGHGIPLAQSDPAEIPDPHKEWRLSYVDRFGNLVTFDNRDGAGGHEIFEIGTRVRLQIGNVIDTVIQGTSLADAEPGALVMYGNDRNVEVVRKWKANDSEHPENISAQSAYSKFAFPRIGSAVKTYVCTGPNLLRAA